jgi:hypothetical protein
MLSAIQCVLTVKENPMTSSINLSIASASADMGDSVNQAPVFAGDKLGSALPRPVRSLPAIADSGRISFGAGFRLPVKK